MVGASLLLSRLFTTAASLGSTTAAECWQDNSVTIGYLTKFVTYIHAVRSSSVQYLYGHACTAAMNIDSRYNEELLSNLQAPLLWSKCTYVPQPTQLHNVCRGQSGFSIGVRSGFEANKSNYTTN